MASGCILPSLSRAESSFLHGAVLRTTELPSGCRSGNPNPEEPLGSHKPDKADFRAGSAPVDILVLDGVTVALPREKASVVLMKYAYLVLPGLFQRVGGKRVAEPTVWLKGYQRRPLPALQAHTAPARKRGGGALIGRSHTPATLFPNCLLHRGSCAGFLACG